MFRVICSVRTESKEIVVQNVMSGFFLVFFSMFYTLVEVVCLVYVVSFQSTDTFTFTVTIKLLTLLTIPSFEVTFKVDEFFE